MNERQRIVIDTNVLISRLMLTASIPAQAVRHVIDHAQLIMSEALFAELANVLSRPKFDPYITIEARQGFIQRLGRIAHMVDVLHHVQMCRDRKDDIILEAAINGEATCIITGDKDLRVLHPFRGIAIRTPADYLETLNPPG